MKGRYLCANKVQRLFLPSKKHNIYIYPHGSEIWIGHGTILEKSEIESRGTRNTMCGEARRPFKGRKGCRDVGIWGPSSSVSSFVFDEMRGLWWEVGIGGRRAWLGLRQRQHSGNTACSFASGCAKGEGEGPERPCKSTGEGCVSCLVFSGSSILSAQLGSGSIYWSTTPYTYLWPGAPPSFLVVWLPWEYRVISVRR